MEPVGRTILAAIQEQRGPLIDFLGRLVMAESPSSNPASQIAVRQLLADELAELDYRTLLLPGTRSGGHLYARPAARRRDQPLQLIVGHYDTVWPLGTLAEMPFEIDGSIVRGPGAFDMKGGLAQIVFALQAINKLDLNLSVTPCLLLNSDEEIGSRSSRRYIEWLAKQADRALVLEPALGAEGALKTARKGVGRYTVTVRGKAAHAGLDPERGVSAILELSHVIQQLFALNDPAHAGKI